MCFWETKRKNRIQNYPVVHRLFLYCEPIKIIDIYRDLYQVEELNARMQIVTIINF